VTPAAGEPGRAADDPSAADPGAADPGAADPGAADPGAADPGAGGLGAEYRNAGFAARIGWGGSPALLVVDAVRAYSDAGSPLWLAGAAGALGAVARLVDAARAAGRPVIWTRVGYRPGAGEAALFRAKVPALRVFEEGDPLGAWSATVGPATGETVVTKHFASAFFGTDLSSELTAARVDTVVVCGFSTSGCVRASATDALQHGFRPMVVADAVADRDPGVQRANLFDLDAKYADVVGVGDALDALTGPAARRPGGGDGGGS